MKEYPWNETRQAIREFQSRVTDWILELPEDLSADEVRRLFAAHVPTEFVAFDLLWNLLDHSHCPREVIVFAAEKLWEMRKDIDMCLSALALRSETPLPILEDLATRCLLSDIGDHALGTLVGRYTQEQDHEAKNILIEMANGLRGSKQIQELLNYIAESLEDQPR